MRHLRAKPANMIPSIWLLVALTMCNIPDIGARHASNRAASTTLARSDPHLRFRHVGKVHMNQGTGHIRFSFPLLSSSMMADRATKAVLLLSHRAQTWSKNHIVAGARYATTVVHWKGFLFNATLLLSLDRFQAWQQIEMDCNKSMQAIMDINAAVGTRGVLLEAIEADVDPEAPDFATELATKLPSTALHELEQRGANLTQYSHVRPKGHNGRFMDSDVRQRGRLVEHQQLHSGTEEQVQLVRVERQAALVAGVIGLFSGGLAVYNRYEISQIQGQLNVAAHERSMIVHSVSELSTRTSTLAKSLNELIKRQEKEHVSQEYMSLAQALTDAIDDLRIHMNFVVNQAFSQKIDASLIREEAWAEEIDSLRHLARLRGNYDLAFLSPVDMLGQRCAVEMQWHGSLHFIVPVPLYSRAQDFDLWEFQQLPIRTPSGWAEVSLKTPYLMTLNSPSTVFVDYSQAQVDQCYPSRDVLVCPPSERTYAQNRRITGLHNARCLFSLFRKDDEGVDAHCGIRLVEQEEDARRIGPRKFGVFTSWDDEIRISCTDNSRVSRTIEAGITIVTLPIDCTAETNTVILRPHVEIDAQHVIEDDTIPFPPSIMKVANATEATMQDIKSKEKSLSVQFQPAPAIDWLEENVDTIGKAANNSRTFTVIAVIVVIILAILLCGSLCRFKRGKKTGPSTGGNVIHIQNGTAGTAARRRGTGYDEFRA